MDAETNVGGLFLFARIAITAVLLLSGCAPVEPYRQSTDNGNTICEPSLPASDAPSGRAATGGAVSASCSSLYTERSNSYMLHFVEFDDQGWIYDSSEPAEDLSAPNTSANQIDSAVEQIKQVLSDPDQRVRLFVYVHGWRHFAETQDSDVRQFRLFLKAMNEVANGAKVIGIYVGWRGLPIRDGTPLTYLTFWDRKSAAERVAQGSVRELFGRLHGLASFRAPPSLDPALTKKPAIPDDARLHTYVIAHSFGSSLAFRAVSQSIVDSFTGDLDTDAVSVSRFVDMVVLVNPAIEASRFEVVRRSALKRQLRCEAAHEQYCDQPKYQAPVLAVFQSEGDWATQKTFPVGAILGNLFQKEISIPEEYADRHTIGWDDRYLTHRMRLDKTCGGTATDGPHLTIGGVDRYSKPGWKWCTTPDNIAIEHLGVASSRLAYNGPLWNVRVDSSIMKNHDDIWNPKFRSVLIKLFADEAVNPIAVN